MDELFSGELEDMAYHLTLLLSAVSPSINRGQTYNYVLALLQSGMEEESTLRCGRLIRRTRGKPNIQDCH